MTLITSEGLAILASGAAFAVLGFVTNRVIFAVIPLAGAIGFLAVTWASNDLYERIPEDVQATVVFALALGALGALVGVLLRRATIGLRERSLSK